MNRPITLITDFGTRDAYAGCVKGVIYSIHPKAFIVDISHEVAPGDIRQAAILLLSSWRYFPKGTIHVIIVDPGVGTERRILCLRHAQSFFLAPDNGVLWPLWTRLKKAELREVTNAAYFLKPTSFTFHGRDKFAPVSAHLARRDIFKRLGDPTRTLVCLTWPEPEIGKKRIRGSVIYQDRFGNCITNIESDLLKGKGRARLIRVGRIRVPLWVRTYGEAPRRKACCLINSFQVLEIALNGESAARRLGIRLYDPVILEW